MRLKDGMEKIQFTWKREKSRWEWAATTCRDEMEKSEKRKERKLGCGFATHGRPPMATTSINNQSMTIFS